ncbi:hypothetical protein JST97_34240 [bacterium]|nr:hypothetical protein [bacterium]
MLTLESILNDLQRQGTKDSSGSFTVDPSQALPKLQKFRIPDAHAYVLKWLQAAVRGGASSFDLQSGTSSVQVQMPGVRLPLERLPHIFLELLGATRPGEEALTHLAVGLHCCLGVRARAIRLFYRDGQRGVKIEWRTEGQTVQDWKASGPPLCRIELERASSDLWQELRQKLHGRPALSMLTGSSAGYDNEQHLVHGTGDLAPLRVTINGRLLKPASVSLKSFAGLLSGRRIFRREYCFAAGDAPGFQLAPWEQAPTSLGRTPEGRYLAFVAHLNRPKLNHLMLVRDGIVLRRMQYQSDQEASYLLILDAQQLTTDLTTLQLVENDDFRQFFHKAQAFAQDPGLLNLPRI